VKAGLKKALLDRILNQSEALETIDFKGINHIIKVLNKDEMTLFLSKQRDIISKRILEE
jgi:hypothetical protein